jgi:signal transduction histidine kinase
MLMERAKHEFDKRNDQKVDLLKVIDEVMEEYDALPNFNVFNYIQRPNSPLWVCGNLDDLHHVFSNIVSNAFKYGGEKTPEIQFIEDTNQVTVIIRDFGVGISEEDIEYVFFPFHRGKNVAGKPGTGLGLAIVYELIEQMGGEIKVKSTEGVSTAFYITIAK